MSSRRAAAPLWSESQKVQLDEQGRYVVLLGATSPDGLPLDFFTSGKALWLGVQPQLSGAGELPRVLLVAVPYALKASDSDTLGGKPASAYALAGSPTVVALSGGAAPSSTDHRRSRAARWGQRRAVTHRRTRWLPPAPPSPVTARRAPTSVAKFTSACNVQNSLLRDNGTGVAVGGTSSTGAWFDVQFTSTATGGTLLGQRVLTTLNPAAASSATTNGLFSNVITASGNTQNFTSTTYASKFEVDHFGTGTLAIGYGLTSTVVNRAAGTVTSAYGIYSSVANFSTGTIGTGYGVLCGRAGEHGRRHVLKLHGVVHWQSQRRGGGLRGVFGGRQELLRRRRGDRDHDPGRQSGSERDGKV